MIVRLLPAQNAWEEYRQVFRVAVVGTKLPLLDCPTKETTEEEPKPSPNQIPLKAVYLPMPRWIEQKTQRLPRKRKELMQILFVYHRHLGISNGWPDSKDRNPKPISWGHHIRELRRKRQALTPALAFEVMSGIIEDPAASCRESSTVRNNTNFIYAR